MFPNPEQDKEQLNPQSSVNETSVINTTPQLFSQNQGEIEETSDSGSTVGPTHTNESRGNSVKSWKPKPDSVLRQSNPASSLQNSKLSQREIRQSDSVSSRKKVSADLLGSNASDSQLHLQVTQTTQVNKAKVAAIELTFHIDRKAIEVLQRIASSTLHDQVTREQATAALIKAERIMLKSSKKSFVYFKYFL